MLSRLRRFAIGTRFTALFVLILAGFAIDAIYSAQQSYDSLLSGRKASVQNVVQISAALVDFYQSRVEQGELSEAEARQQALEHIRQFRYDGDEYLWVNDFSHVMLMHPIQRTLEGTDVGDMQDPQGTFLFQEMVKTAETEGQGFVHYFWPKPGFDTPVEKVSYVAADREWGWIIGSGVYLDEVQAQYHAQLASLLASLTGIMLLILGVIYLLVQSIIRPLRQTVARMESIAEGEGDLTVRLNAEGDDEITRIARHFNTFTSKIQDLVMSVSGSADSVTRSAQILHEETTAVALRLEEQAAETDQVASAVQEMAAAAQDIASHAEQAARSADTASEQTVTGKSVVDNTLDVIGSLADELKQTAALIGALETETQNIGSVLAVIGSIAEQTNLLALNAAIEAARAGEQGRGFAVVADEVRSLASKTQNSTTEINEMIQRLRQVVNEAVQSMNANTGKSLATVEEARRAVTALEGIAASIAVINDMNTQIATASEEQSQVAEEISRNVTRISGLSSDCNSSAQSVLASSGDLGSLADTLKQRCDQFKTG